MKVVDDVMGDELKIKTAKKVKIEKLYEIDGTKEIYIGTYRYNKELYEGVISSDGSVVVPFSKTRIKNIFSTKDYTNYCIVRYDEGDNNFESFHLQKEDNTFKLATYVKGNEKTSCRLIGTEKDEYWFVETITRGIKELNLYDVYNHKIITPNFSEIIFQEDSPRVLAYVEKHIFKHENEDNIFLGNIMSFIDYDGNFVTPIYIPEKDIEYDARNFNFDKTFKSFNLKVEAIAYSLEMEYCLQNDKIDEHLNYLYENPYSIADMQPPKTKAKIINYNSRRKR